MKNLDFPIQFKFKITSLANDFTATDASGHTIAYIRQKMFKLKEDIEIFDDENKNNRNFQIKADSWLDFSAAYSFFDGAGTEMGKIARKGWRSLWKAEYDLIDQNDNLQYHIREENAWVKVIDGMLGGIPILGFLSGYFFNPSYTVTDENDRVVVRLKKQPSFWGRKFTVNKLLDIDQDDAQRILLGLMMMILLERERG